MAAKQIQDFTKHEGEISADDDVTQNTEKVSFFFSRASFQEQWSHGAGIMG